MSDPNRLRDADTSGADLARRLQQVPWGDRFEQRVIQATDAVDRFFQQKVDLALLANQVRQFMRRRLHRTRRDGRRQLV